MIVHDVIYNKEEEDKNNTTIQQYNTISMIHSITECNTIQQIKQYNKEYNNSPELRMNEWMNEWMGYELTRTKTTTVWYNMVCYNLMWYSMVWYMV